MNYNNLAVWYKTVFAMVHYHKYSFTEVLEMLPYERDLFVDLIVNDIEKRKQQSA